ncbi:MAG: T9SS type A sorting domain-containing protein, partial [Flavobacteriales bacterium]|nr:T9SS type A sorting domain-containing protein [Flavobacteriales bacterium]
TGTTTNKNRISLSRNNPNDLLFSYVDLDFAQMEDIYSDYSSPNLLLPQEHQKPNLIEMGQRTTSVNEIELYSENKIFVYPNPLQASNRTLYLSGVRDLESVSIQLLDMNGREIQKVENVLDNLILHPSDLQKGSYILNILSQDQSSQIKLVVN